MDRMDSEAYADQQVSNHPGVVLLGISTELPSTTWIYSSWMMKLRLP